MLKKLLLDFSDGQKMRKLEIQVVYSARKTLGLEVDREGLVWVRAPLRAPEQAIRRMVEEKKAWIVQNVLKMEARQKEAMEKGVPDYVKYPALENRYRRQAREKLQQRTAYFARLMGVSYGKITVRAAKTRWGSCSGRGNLNFHWKLVLMPPEVLDYVVVHELAHRKEMNHSPAFWAEVKKILPDYQERRRWLKTYGQGV